MNIARCLALPKTPSPGPNDTVTPRGSEASRPRSAGLPRVVHPPPASSVSSKSSSKREAKPGPNLRLNISAGSMDMDSWCGHGFLACGEGGERGEARAGQSAVHGKKKSSRSGVDGRNSPRERSFGALPYLRLLRVFRLEHGHGSAVEVNSLGRGLDRALLPRGGVERATARARLAQEARG